MHEETTEPIQNAAQVIEGAAQVDVGNVDMPVLMRLQRLLHPNLEAKVQAVAKRAADCDKSVTVRPKVQQLIPKVSQIVR